MKMPKPKNKLIEHWPCCSYFAIYDGSGGTACAEYLKQKLHLLITA
jgi:hypothetical protein